MKCFFDPDRKAFYMVPVTAADRLIITNVLNLQQAGDHVALVRQDVPRSDGVLSHLEVCRYNYTPPVELSAYEKEFLDANPTQALPRAAGVKGSRLADYITRRLALQNVIAGLLPGIGDVIMLPTGTTVTDPLDPIVVEPGPTTPRGPTKR